MVVSLSCLKKQHRSCEFYRLGEKEQSRGVQNQVNEA